MPPAGEQEEEEGNRADRQEGRRDRNTRRPCQRRRRLQAASLASHTLSTLELCACEAPKRGIVDGTSCLKTHTSSSKVDVQAYSFAAGPSAAATPKQHPGPTHCLQPTDHHVYSGGSTTLSVCGCAQAALLAPVLLSCPPPVHTPTHPPGCAWLSQSMWGCRTPRCSQDPAPAAAPSTACLCSSRLRATSRPSRCCTTSCSR